MLTEYSHVVHDTFVGYESSSDPATSVCALDHHCDVLVLLRGAGWNLGGEHYYAGSLVVDLLYCERVR